jgi:hypothetical protein
METGDFDPEEFTFVDLPPDVRSLRLDANAVVTTSGLDRPVSIQDVRTRIDGSGRVVLEGEIFNLGTSPVTVAGLLVSMYDADGALIWVDWVLVSEAARPGLASRFQATLMARERLAVVDVPAAGFVNGVPVEPASQSSPSIAVPTVSGYSGLSLTAVAFQRPST